MANTERKTESALREQGIAVSKSGAKLINPEEVIRTNSEKVFAWLTEAAVKIDQQMKKKAKGAG